MDILKTRESPWRNRIFENNEDEESREIRIYRWKEIGWAEMKNFKKRKRKKEKN